LTLYAALVVAVVLASGTFLLLQRDLFRVVIGIILVSNSATLFIVASGLSGGAPPIYPLPDGGVSDPLVQAMALTALIIGFGVAALLFAMVYQLYASHGTMDLEEIAEAEAREAEALDLREDPGTEEVPEEEQDAEPEAGTAR
jgi:multicomponent Na+:H+ antiporter subunit C